eukprot:5218914-Prymnesium_polylepis.2
MRSQRMLSYRREVEVAGSLNVVPLNVHHGKRAIPACRVVVLRGGNLQEAAAAREHRVGPHVDEVPSLVSDDSELPVKVAVGRVRLEDFNAARLPPVEDALRPRQTSLPRTAARDARQPRAVEDLAQAVRTQEANSIAGALPPAVRRVTERVVPRVVRAAGRIHDCLAVRLLDQRHVHVGGQRRILYHRSPRDGEGVVSPDRVHQEPLMRRKTLAHRVPHAARA